MIKRKKHRRFGCKLQEKLYAKEKKLEALNYAHKRCVAVRDIQITKQKASLETMIKINVCLMKELGRDCIEIKLNELKGMGLNEVMVVPDIDSIKLRLINEKTVGIEPTAD